MTDQTTAPTGVVSSDQFGHYERLMREFEEWAFVRDFDTTRSTREPMQYDAEHHKRNAQATRRKALRTADLFDAV